MMHNTFFPFTKWTNILVNATFAVYLIGINYSTVWFRKKHYSVMFDSIPNVGGASETCKHYKLERKWVQIGKIFDFMRLFRFQFLYNKYSKYSFCFGAAMALNIKILSFGSWLRCCILKYSTLQIIYNYSVSIIFLFWCSARFSFDGIHPSYKNIQSIFIIERRNLPIHSNRIVQRNIQYVLLPFKMWQLLFIFSIVPISVVYLCPSPPLLSFTIFIL